MLFILVILVFMYVYFLKFLNFPLGARFLPMTSFVILLGTVLVNHPGFAQATYLRAHKKEPLLLCTVVMTCFMGLSTYFLGRYYAAFGIVLGYFILALFGLLWITMIFIKKRKVWHDNERGVSLIFKNHEY